LPAVRRRDGLDPYIPFDVIVFRRQVSATSTVEVTIDRAILARAIARRASANTGGKTRSLFGAISAVILNEES
jgi:hypothetical protein